jgi:hypothetical protein
MVKVTVISVTWNSAEHIGALLSNLPSDPAYEIIVVDNASQDQTVPVVEKTFPHVKLIKNARNEFLSRATNQAARVAQGEYLLLLNPDIIIGKDAVDRMLQFMQADARIGAVGPQLRYPDGQIQPSCREFPTYGNILWEFTLIPRVFKSLSKWKMGYFDHKGTREVDQPMGSCLMVRKDAFFEVGMMEESFPLFYNDVALCLRITRAGRKNYFLSDAHALHHHGGSTRRVRSRMIIESSRSLYRYFKNRFGTGLILYFTGITIFASMVLRVILAQIAAIFRPIPK